MCTCPCKYSCVKQHLLNANGWPKDLPSCLWLVFGTVAEGKWRSKLASSALRNQLFSLWLKSGDEALPRPLAETPAGVFDPHVLAHLTSVPPVNFLLSTVEGAQLQPFLFRPADLPFHAIMVFNIRLCYHSRVMCYHLILPDC